MTAGRVLAVATPLLACGLAALDLKTGSVLWSIPAADSSVTLMMGATSLYGVDESIVAIGE